MLRPVLNNCKPVQIQKKAPAALSTAEAPMLRLLYIFFLHMHNSQNRRDQRDSRQDNGKNPVVCHGEISDIALSQKDQ